MNFMFLFYADERAIGSMTPEQSSVLVEQHTAFNQMLEERVTVHAARGLQPTPTAHTVRPRNGEITVRPGPFASTSETLLGFYLVECEDLDEALELAKAYPMREGLGCIEIRPLVTDWDYAPSAKVAAPPEEVWRRYADLACWPSWQAGVTEATLDGPLKGGASGHLTLTDQPDGRVPLRIMSATENQGFVSETELAPGAVVRTEHRLERLPDGGTRVVHRANVPRAVLDALGVEYGPVLYARMRQSVQTLAATVEREAS